MEPAISVIIPVYNDAARLKLCLEALEQQTYPLSNFEVLVVNNNSTEDIKSVTVSSKLNLVYLEESKPGSYPARNLAIKHAKANILAFTDSDCIPDSNWLSAGVECLKSEENVGVVAGAIELFYKSPILTFTEIYEKYTAFHQEQGARQGYNTTANWFSYKTTIVNAGCFEETLKSNGDSILSNKIYKDGYKIKYCAAAIINHPARSRYSEIANKRKRIIGGRYDMLKLQKRNLPIGMLKACLSFFRSNIKRSASIFSANKADGIKYLILVTGLFFSIVLESVFTFIWKEVWPMKIVRLATSLNFGGVEKRIEISSAEFQKRKELSLSVIAIGGGGTIADSLKQLNINTTLLNLKPAIPNLKAIVSLYKLFKSIKPDVVHTSGAEANFHGLIAAYFAGVKVRIGEEIGFPHHKFIWRIIFNIVYRFANNVIGISEAVVKKIVSLGEVKLDKTTVVYNPVEIAEIDFSKKKAPDNEFVFITVSRLVAIKNLSNLLLAFKEVCNNTLNLNVKLHIVGSGPEQQALERLAAELSIANKIIFLGFHADVVPILLQADAYVLPSYSEGFSIALVEAMQTELVCLATNVGGPTEIINDNVTGMLINPHSVDDMKTKMLAAINLTIQQRTEMGAAARRDVLKRFTPKRYIDNLLALYRSCQK